jgi:hypothetical protein
MYLVDDFKPENCRRDHVVRVIQAYADLTSRGRLRSDGTPNTSRRIRGFMVVTGEDVVEHTSSGLARTIAIPAEAGVTRIAEGRRCLDMERHYSRMTADFVCWLLATGQTTEFAQRVQSWQERLLGRMPQRSNSLRICTNFARLAAALDVMTEYLSASWPDGPGLIRSFLDGEFSSVLVQMVGRVHEEQESQIFLSVLGALIEHRRVRIEGFRHSYAANDGTPIIGRATRQNAGGGERAVVGINMRLSLAAVNRHLREEGRPELRGSHSNIRQQLCDGGHLADDNEIEAQRLPESPRIDGRSVRVLYIRSESLGLGAPP